MTTFVVTDAGWTELGSGDLPSSGVTAGTYGDATHVGQVTVDAQGIVTAAANVAIAGGGGTAGLVQLFDSTLAADAASIDTGAGGIASGHGHLIVVVLAQSAAVAAGDTAVFTVNNDTSASYDRQTVTFQNTTIAASETLADTAWRAGGMNAQGAGSTSYFTSFDFLIASYDNTSLYKTGRFFGATADSNSAQIQMRQTAIGYRSMAAISRMAVSAAGGNLKAGSRLTVYGTQ